MGKVTSRTTAAWHSSKSLPTHPKYTALHSKSSSKLHNNPNPYHVFTDLRSFYTHWRSSSSTPTPTSSQRALVILPDLKYEWLLRPNCAEYRKVHRYGDIITPHNAVFLKALRLKNKAGLLIC